MYGLILGAGLALEVTKHTSIKCYQKSVIWIDDTSDALDDRFGTVYPCDGTIMCQRTGVRHRKGCIGRTERFDVWARQLI